MAEPSSAAEASGRSLAAIDLLRAIPAERLRAVEARCQWRETRPGDVVFELDDPTAAVFFIVRGKLRIVIRRDGPDDADRAAPAEGADAVPESSLSELVTLAEFTSGDTFGELAAVDGRPRSARAVALDNGLLAILPREDFLDLVEAHPPLAMALLRRFAGFIRSLNRRVHSLSTLTPRQRVFMELVRLAEPRAVGDGTWAVDPLPAHGDIAGWVGADRETVAAAVGQLAREGLVERRHKTLIIRDLARLRLLAHLT
ncbi:cAMP-binding protein [Caenispirillum salinarum AK4]|uniref:cAMP-binding protein n=1 Tax=Caenispirillum salinarum AK4 TaxID=1238182 RepID=K9HK41_9PROT|nr:Crp/Fnr family transcriptional regulator [Caenispirillum salinarum]EKV30698.1 cAMP-binding protein [Caenispirillum salinarum AK4]